MSLSPNRLERGLRKAMRPLRRMLVGAPSAAHLDDIGEVILVLIAHPDDEVFCSGLICHLLARGTAVHLLALTRGEGGERGDLADHLSLVATREGELHSAAKALGVSSLTFLDYPDPPSVDGKLSAPEYDAGELLAEIQGHLDRLAVTDLITHGSGGEYWHPAHLCLHRQGRALARRNATLQLWTFNAWKSDHPLQGVLNQDDPAHLTLDASAFHEKRQRALAAHSSQKAVFERFCKGTLDDFIKLTSQENLRRW